MSKSSIADGVFSAQRLLPYTAAQVFAAFTDPAVLATWWGPDGFTNTFKVFEFKPKGRWEFDMHGPDGKTYPNEAVFLEVDPQRIVIQHTCAPIFTLIITIAELEGQTLLRWQQAFEDPAVAAGVAHIVEPANEQNLNRLQAALARMAG